MESVLGRGSNGQAIDLVVVTNKNALTSGQTEFQAIDQGYDFTSDGANIEGLLQIQAGANVTAAAKAGTEVNACTSTSTTATLTSGNIVADNDYKGSTLRLFKAAGATLNESSPLSGDASPHGPKGYDDVIITGTDKDTEVISFAATLQAANYYTSCAVLAGVLFTASGVVTPNSSRQVVIVTRAR